MTGILCLIEAGQLSCDFVGEQLSARLTEAMVKPRRFRCMCAECGWLPDDDVQSPTLGSQKRALCTAAA